MFRPLTVLIAALSLAAPAAAQSTLGPPLDRAVSAYAGSGQFGAIVDIDGDTAVVYEPGDKTVSVLSTDPLAFVVSDLGAGTSLATAQTIFDVAIGFGGDAVVVVFLDVNGHGRQITFAEHNGTWVVISETLVSLFSALADEAFVEFGASNRFMIVSERINTIHWLRGTISPGTAPAPPSVSLVGNSEWGGRMLRSLDASPNGHYAIGMIDTTTFEASVSVTEVGQIFGFDVFLGVGGVTSPYPLFTGFGDAVALSDDGQTLFVGTPGANTGPSSPGGLGAVDQYTLGVPTTTHVTTLTSGDDVSFEAFGWSLACEGDVLAIGERDHELYPDQNLAGMVRLARPGDGAAWGLTGEIFQSLTDPGQVAADFGESLAISGDALFIGVPGQAGGGSVTLFTGFFDDLRVVLDQPAPLAGFGGVAPEFDLSAGIYAGPGIAPGPVIVHVEGARPNAPAFVVIGLSVLDAPLKQGVLHPAPTLLLSLATDADGELYLPAAWSEEAVAFGDLTIPMQVWIQDPDGPKGFSATAGAQLRQFAP